MGLNRLARADDGPSREGRCYEEAVKALTGLEPPELDGDDWTRKLQIFLEAHGWRAKFVLLDERCIVSRRLTNGKVHAEIMHPTVITTIERIKP